MITLKKRVRSLLIVGVILLIVLAVVSCSRSDREQSPEDLDVAWHYESFTTDGGVLGT